ncbi:isocitrate/isopropylmalate dehydrogenase family protein [Candidatus Bipolaricaulota bacterium]|nr:isocitrate/isopropylmalate dehydrogenase family protein [Candidatus Bipolaricaulota bacterium]
MEQVKVSLITGDGIGPEISRATRRIIDSSSAKIDWEIVETNPRQEDGDVIIDRMISSIEETSVGLKGPITTPIGSGYSSLTVALRKKLNLYANVRPVKKLLGLGPNFQAGDVDLVTVRENTEGLYSGIEHEIAGEYAESIKLVTRKGSEKIARFAFEYAKSEEREKVTAIHKANILKQSDGLFLDTARGISRDYPGIKLDEKIVDNMAMQLILHPEDYEILLAPNLYGDILSDLSAGLIGGLGVAPGGNFGDDLVVFEAVHGSAPDIAGQNVANPLGLLRSGIMMLNHVDQPEAAGEIEAAVDKVLEEREVLTPDLGGNSTTTELTDEIIGYL